MKYEYIIEEQDLVDFQLFTASKSVRINKKKRNGRLILTIGSLLLGFNFYYKDNITLALYFTCIAIVAWLLFPIYFKWKYKNHYRRFTRENYSMRFGTKEELELKKEYIFVKDNTGEGKVKLTEIENVSETQNHFFVKMSSGTSLIIPKDKLSSPEEMKQEFAQLKIPIINEINWVWN